MVAWSKMIVDYSAQDGLIEGTRKTFDGEHPCSMCKAITEGKKQESKRSDDKAPVNSQGLVLKECLFQNSFEVPAPKSLVIVSLAFPDLDLRGDSFGVAPPSPPPRGRA